MDAALFSASYPTLLLISFTYVHQPLLNLHIWSSWLFSNV